MLLKVIVNIDNNSYFNNRRLTVMTIKDITYA